MPHALLLSPDDQAVSAITAVLDEMSVTCERPLDGPSAAKKLTSQSFDLVLVDCENLPAAKLIFDVCRRSQNGTNPVPIAIVDGRAGLPTAFRLGAELILTKPVAKDQARTTIRTAVSRVKKEEPARTVHPFEEPVATSAPIAEPELEAAAAAAGASSTANPVSESTQTPDPAQATVTARMYAATEEIKLSKLVKPQPPFFTEKPVTAGVPATEMFMPPPPPAVKPSDDPVLADLESDLPTPQVFSSYLEQPKKSSSGSLWALLAIMILGGGSYAAWMYQPGFREFVQPQVDKVMAMIGQGKTPQAVAVRPAAPVPASVPAPPVKAAEIQPAPAAAANTSNTTEASTTDAPAASSTSANASVAVAAPTLAPESTVKPAPEPVKSAAPAEAKKEVLLAPSDSELPGEKSAIILSSQGAEKRLIRHLAPPYPADARKAGIEGTVVLKTVVSETGTVQGVRLVEGNPALATAAITSVKQWHYRPYVRDGKALPFQTIVLVEFQRP
jgi:periplasmic protein TonB